MGFWIGNVHIGGPLVLGPMAGVTDLPFRLLCREQGADLIYTEMVSAKGILYKNKNTAALLRTQEAERPVALQFFGENPGIMAEMAKYVEELPFDILDINMGCPVPKVVNNGEGSALMKNTVRVGEIVSAISRAIRKPVTVKIRAGFDGGHINAAEVARVAQESGAAAVAVPVSFTSDISGRGGSSPVSRYCFAREKNHGFPCTARATITASQPVSCCIQTTSCTVFTSPLPITGIETASFTLRITPQSAAPL